MKPKTNLGQQVNSNNDKAAQTQHTHSAIKNNASQNTANAAPPQNSLSTIICRTRNALIMAIAVFPTFPPMFPPTAFINYYAS